MSLEHRLHSRCGCGRVHESSASSSAALGRPFAFASSPRQFERDRPFSVRHIALDLTLDITAKTVEGSATLDVVRVDSEADELLLDAVGFQLRALSVDGARCDYVYDGQTIRIAIGRSVKTARVLVSYRATPRKGMYFLEPDEHVPQRPRQVWTQCQEEDARYWMPCVDKPHVKMTTEVTVHVPRGFYALSNGDLATRETPDDAPMWKFHWRMNDPHPSYLMTLVAGEFAEITARAGDVPLVYLVPKGREDDGARTFARTPEMIAHFSDITGVPYPWSRYTQVVVSDFIFGGMENTTATTMYEHILLDARASLDISSDDLIAHELAHQWFGDYVTCRDWSEGWLNEGFATYMEHVWREHHLGRDEYEYGIKHDLDAYVLEARGRYRRPIVCLDYDAPLDLFDRHLYEKGGLTLHMLRVELGKDRFWKGVNLYLTRHARSGVETRDLMHALEEVSGRSLGRFFEQSVQRSGHPEIEVSIQWDKRVLTASVKQTHGTQDGVPQAFEFPLTLEIVDDAGGTRREKLNVTQRGESFALPCARRPRFVVVDPDFRIVGEVELKVPGDMLRAQLETAETGRGRWTAAHALAKSDDPVTIEALSARLRDDEEFWGVRVEAAAALGAIRAKEAFEALRRATQIAHPKVRRAVTMALGSFRTVAAFEAIRPLALKDASYLVEAEAARALGRTQQAAALEMLIDLLERPSWADVVRAGALDGLAALRDERALPHLFARVRYGHSERARRAALMALPKLSSDRKTREAIEELLDDRDPHVRIDAVRALTDIGDGRSRGPLRNRLEIDLDARVRRRIREALRDIGGESKGAVAQLREELEKVQQSHSELKTRLAQFEARFEEGSGGAKGRRKGPDKKPIPSSKVTPKKGRRERP